MPADSLVAQEGAIRGALEALARVGEDLAGKASRLAPVEEGTLRGSFTVVLMVSGQRFEGGAGAIGAAVAAAVRILRAGGRPRLDVEVAANTIYAAYQHEELGLEHPLGGQAQYLEEPLNQNSGRYSRIVALSAARGIEGAPGA